MVGFSDMSLIAVCAMIYIVWEDIQGRYSARLMMAKCRVAPLVGTTMPRGELLALVVLHWLLGTVAETFPILFKYISVYTDLACCLGTLSKTRMTMKPFFALWVLVVRTTAKPYQEIGGHATHTRN